MPESKQTLGRLFEGRVFVIPDYQRGYAWEEKQWKDLVDDVEALALESCSVKITYHYTGTIVTYQGGAKEIVYDRNSARCVEVVDGQQRLTTICLYLAEIIRALIENGQADYERDIVKYLYHGIACRLTPGNDTDRLYFHLLKDGRANTEALTDHQKRLIRAGRFFSLYVKMILDDPGRGVRFLESLFRMITSRLIFTEYSIDEECEVGMTFELMNARGKGLSVLELLKNYFMHWIARNGVDKQERTELSGKINHAWKDIYLNLGRTSAGSESQCLRVAWTLYCNHQPRSWAGYEGFKADPFFPLRGFDEVERQKIKERLDAFMSGLVEVSHQYSLIIDPKGESSGKEEECWLQRINRTDHMANFLPLLVAARMKRDRSQIGNNEFIALMNALECYAYRVFLMDGKRSNAGKTALFRLGWELFHEPGLIDRIITRIYGLIPLYVIPGSFSEQVNRPCKWYNRRHLLKYTLFEYEQHLLDEYHEMRSPQIGWDELALDSTIEHILPQNPEPDSEWMRKWTEEQRNTYLHDIGNLVLTRDNARYKNLDFVQKKGSSESGICYARSDIRQERDIAVNEDWTMKELLARREKIASWILERWKLPQIPPDVVMEEEGEDDAPDWVEH